jgi:hypothetical protein
MIWQEFAAAAPELARLGKERLEATGVALLGTLHKDGSPRISPVEPYIVEGHLLLGLMSRSRKAMDLRRDPRCVVHSAVCKPDGSEGEFKLYGRAEPVRDRRIRDSADRAWWVERPADDAFVVSLDVESAAFVSWNTDAGEMTVKRWTPERGARKVRLPYP